jgi:ribonuclease D
VTWIRTAAALEDLTRSLEGCSAIGLDTESDSLYHHKDKVCLAQIATDRGEAYLVDCLAVDLRPLAHAMARPDLVKVLHGADYDVTTLKRDFGFRFESLFDTMIAARLLGRSELGLVAVARDELGVTLTKTNQKDDWSRRPLTPQQEAYALADVVHLLALRGRLVPRLEAVARLSWLREECDAVAALEPLTRRRDPDAYLSVKGARRLPRRALAALRELHAWRERRADETDIPAFKIVGNETLVKLAELLPASAKELRAVPGVMPRLSGQADAILAAVGRAREVPEALLPTLPRVAKPVVSEAALKRIESLKAWRTRKGQELGLDPSVLLPLRLIERVADRAPREPAELRAIEGFRRWRVEAFGNELVAAVS